LSNLTRLYIQGLKSLRGIEELRRLEQIDVTGPIRDADRLKKLALKLARVNERYVTTKKPQRPKPPPARSAPLPPTKAKPKAGASGKKKKVRTAAGAPARPPRDKTLWYWSASNGTYAVSICRSDGKLSVSYGDPNSYRGGGGSITLDAFLGTESDAHREIRREVGETVFKEALAKAERLHRAQAT
jgi:hypothetical protein